MNCINCDEPASKCGCDPAVLRDAWEDRAVNAEARVKELEAQKLEHGHWCVEGPTRTQMASRITQLEADLAAARTVVDAAWRWLRAGENDPDRGERAALERAFAAIERTPKVAAQPARTINAHALVADVVDRARKVDELSQNNIISASTDDADYLTDAIAALDAAGITIQPVRTLSKQEAERLVCTLQDRVMAYARKDYHKDGFAGHIAAWDEAYAAVVNALMGVPQATAPVAPPVSQGHDEAGGEGAASGPRWDADHLAMAERAIGPWHIDAPAAITHLIAHLRERDQRKG